MKTKEQIINKINEYLDLPIERRLERRNIGFYDALRWVVDDNEQEMPISCLRCDYSHLVDDFIYCKKLNWPIPNADTRDMLNNRPCWCPFNKERKK